MASEARHPLPTGLAASCLQSAHLGAPSSQKQSFSREAELVSPLFQCLAGRSSVLTLPMHSASGVGMQGELLLQALLSSMVVSTTAKGR